MANERNPFADYSVVYVPYCTGDAHLGNTTTEYAPGLTVHHKGYVNGTAALDYVAATAPGATEVVVVGESAGSIAAPLYAGLVSDRLPDARITVLADGSGSTPTLQLCYSAFFPPWLTRSGNAFLGPCRNSCRQRWSRSRLISNGPATSPTDAPRSHLCNAASLNSLLHSLNSAS